MRKEIIVRAFWDEEAKVWVAEGLNYPGIVAEADNMEVLLDKLTVIIPEIMEANAAQGAPQEDEISIRLLSEICAIAKPTHPHA